MWSPPYIDFINIRDGISHRSRACRNITTGDCPWWVCISGESPYPCVSNGAVLVCSIAESRSTSKRSNIRYVINLKVSCLNICFSVLVGIRLIFSQSDGLECHSSSLASALAGLQQALDALDRNASCPTTLHILALMTDQVCLVVFWEILRCDMRIE